MTTPIPVYLAGPDVFRPDASELGNRKKAICQRNGLDGRFPLDDLDLPSGLDAADPDALAEALFEGCAALMDDCLAGIANLTPFRGISADVGTVFEIGYLLAQNKPVFAYTSETASYDQRVTPDGLFVEPFGLTDNLMVDGAVMRAGRPVVRLQATDGDPLAAIEAFEECVGQAAQILLPAEQAGESNTGPQNKEGSS